MASNYANWGWTGSGYAERLWAEVWYSGNNPVANTSTYGYKIWNNSNNSYGDTGTISWRIADNWSSSRASGSRPNTPTTGYNQVKDYASGSFTIANNANGTMGAINFVLHATRTVGNVRSAAVSVPVTNTPNIDRAVPVVTTSLRSTATTSLTIRMTASNSSLLQTGYQHSGQSWVYGGALPEGTSHKDFTLTGLTPNTSYSLRTFAQRRHNQLSGYSGYVSYTTARVAPAVPGVTFTNVGTASLTITASAAAGTNSPITGWRIYSSNTGGWTGWQTSNVFNITGLASNTSYSFHAQARSGTVDSSYSTFTVKTDSLPPTVGSVSVTSTAVSAISVRANNVVSQTGVSKYTWLRNGATVATTTVPTYTYAGLTPMTQYTLAVTVTSTDGKTSASTGAYGTTKATPVHSASVAISKITQTSLTIVASATAQSGIVKYEFTTNGGASYVSQTSATYTANGLSSGTTHVVGIRVTDKEGNTATKTINQRTHYATPTITGLSVSSITPFTAYASYGYSNPGGTKGSAHRLNGGAWVTATGQPQALSLTGLAPNTQYTLEIYNTNIDGYNSDYAKVVFRTLEDKWVMVSVNGAAFKKANLSLIFPNGTVKKIEKSKGKIIK